METTNKNGFIDLYVLKILNEIKSIVTRNIELDKEKEKEIDKKMSFGLKKVIDANDEVIYNFLSIDGYEENKKERLSLVLYYTALYYENVDLLKYLLKENVKFDEFWYINLQYLDKSISSKFERKQYVEMIKTCGYMFRNFAKSIEKLPVEEKEKYIQRFVKLINLKYDLIRDFLNEETWYSKKNQLDYIFKKENLDTFYDETYKQATVEQLKLINYCHEKKYSQETCDRLNNLMQKRGFANYLCDFDLMMRLYTDEEIEVLGYDISSAISNFSQTEESLKKIIDFLQRRPELARDIVCISKRRFMKTDNYTLIEVCNHVNNKHDGVTDLDLVTRVMKPKAVLKRVLGAYKKKNILK